MYCELGYIVCSPNSYSCHYDQEINILPLHSNQWSCSSYCSILTNMVTADKMINQRSQDSCLVKQVINKNAIFSEIQSILQCLQFIESKLSEFDSILVLSVLKYQLKMISEKIPLIKESFVEYISDIINYYPSSATVSRSKFLRALNQ